MFWGDTPIICIAFLQNISHSSSESCVDKSSLRKVWLLREQHNSHYCSWMQQAWAGWQGLTFDWLVLGERKDELQQWSALIRGRNTSALHWLIAYVECKSIFYALETACILFSGTTAARTDKIPFKLNNGFIDAILQKPIELLLNSMRTLEETKWLMCKTL